ncbi:transcription termination/antitermination factor NusG [Candidatus Dependentiae bacterium]|nr:MAG: transcription termination/antitermination factor NusG [Candidatus Dependentiae bacterium]
MKRWYVVQVFAGYEDLIKADLRKRIQEEGLEEKFGDILIPSARLKQFFSTQEEKDEQLFPGYMLIEMDSIPESIRLVLASPRVIRFLGGKDPFPLSQKEIERVLAQIKGEVVVAPKKTEIAVGSEVTIKDGPFDGFIGIVDRVNEESEKLTVMVSIFGRMTPVELKFHQVKQ